MNRQTKTGISIPEAYIRIDEISGSKELINIRVRIYASQEKHDNKFPWIEEKIISFNPNISDFSPNFIKQGYEYIKSLFEFEGAIDC